VTEKEFTTLSRGNSSAKAVSQKENRKSLKEGERNKREK
jgi:hypothetical protein